MLDILKQVGFAPRACVWELTLACNLRCKHCGSFAGSRRDDEMTLEEVAALLGRSVPTVRKRLSEFAAVCGKEFSP